jgi:hypothetical protein
MTSAMATVPAFQAFQRAFARHLRDPHHTPRPAGVPARRMAVYSELLFNNVCGFLDRCFPVLRSVVGEARWRRLNRIETGHIKISGNSVGERRRIEKRRRQIGCLSWLARRF